MTNKILGPDSYENTVISKSVEFPTGTKTVQFSYGLRNGDRRRATNKLRMTIEASFDGVSFVAVKAGQWIGGQDVDNPQISKSFDARPQFTPQRARIVTDCDTAMTFDISVAFS